MRPITRLKPLNLLRLHNATKEVNPEYKVRGSIRDNTVEDLERRFNDPSAGTHGKSLYDLYNAATNRVTHGSEQRQLQGQNLFVDNLFGNGRNQSVRALEVCLALASGK